MALLGTTTPAAADPIQISFGFLTVTGAQDFNSRGFLRTIAYDLVTDEFRLHWFEGDGVPQNVFAPRLASPGYFNSEVDLVDVASALTVNSTPSATRTPYQGGAAFGSLTRYVARILKLGSCCRHRRDRRHARRHQLAQRGNRAAFPLA